MKLRFYRRWYNDAKRDTTLARATALEPINADWERKWQEEWRKTEPDRAVTSAMARENALARPYSTYLASSIESDFRDGDGVEDVLVDIDRLEKGEIESCLAGTPEHFMHSLTSRKVTFEHALFGECPEWPIWSCTLAQYKAALQGWKQFLQLPKSIDSELIVELPNAAP